MTNLGTYRPNFITDCIESLIDLKAEKNIQSCAVQQCPLIVPSHQKLFYKLIRCSRLRNGLTLIKKFECVCLGQVFVLWRLQRRLLVLKFFEELGAGLPGAVLKVWKITVMDARGCPGASGRRGRRGRHQAVQLGGVASRHRGCYRQNTIRLFFGWTIFILSQFLKTVFVLVFLKTQLLGISSW